MKQTYLLLITLSLFRGNLQAEFEIPFKLDESGQVSLAVYHPDGKRLIRTLLTGEKLEAGSHSVTWDGVDRYGRPVGTGEFTWKLLSTPGFKAEYLLTIGTNPGTAPWHDWVGNHAAPSSVACDGERLHIGSMGENTPGGICMSLDGKERFWDAGNRFAWSGVRSAQFVGGMLVELHTHKLKAEVFVVDAFTGNKMQSFVVVPEEVPKGIERLRPKLSVTDKELFVTFPQLGKVGVFSLPDGKNVRWIAGRKFQDLAYNGKEVLVLEDGKLGNSEGDWECDVPLVNPVCLAAVPGGEKVWVAEGEPSHQIVCVSRKTGKVLRKLGRKGGRKYGAWVASDFREINSICPDYDGGLFIAEGGGGMRRVVRVSEEGDVLSEWFGSKNFFNFSSPNPKDPTRVMFMAGHHSKAIAKVDYRKRTWYPETEFHQEDFGGMFPKSSHHSGQWQLLEEGGELFAFCDSGTHPAIMRMLPETGEMVPVAAMGRVHWNPELAPKIWKAAVKLAGMELKQAPKTWKWVDQDGDGDVEPGEVQLLEIPLGGSRSVFLDEDWNLWIGKNEGDAAWLVFSNKGKPGRPDWDVREPVMGAGKLPSPLKDYPSFKGRGFWKDDAGNIYRQLHANSNPAYSRPNKGWPTCYHGTSRLLKWSADGELEWEIGKHAVRRPGNLFNPSEHTEFHDFTRFLGMFRDCLVVGDRVVRPASVWTSDGLYAGDFFDRRTEDGLPDSVYTWWRDKWTDEDGPVPYDVLTGGSIYPDGDDRLLWFPMGEQNTPVYAVTGWDGWTRQEGVVKVASIPRHPKATGAGLLAWYQSDGGRLERTDRILWFQDRRETSHYISWDKNSEIWDKLGKRAFRVTWEGSLEAPVSEPFVFSAVNHGPDNPTSGEYWHPEWGKVKVWVGGRLVLEQTDTAFRSRNNRPKVYLEGKPWKLKGGGKYMIKVEYTWVIPMEGESKPEFSLLWESPTIERQRIPGKYLYKPDGKIYSRPFVFSKEPTVVTVREGDVLKGIHQDFVTLHGDGVSDVEWVDGGLKVLEDKEMEGTEIVEVSRNPKEIPSTIEVPGTRVIRILDAQLEVPEGRELHYLFNRQENRDFKDASGNGRSLYMRGTLEWAEEGEAYVMRSHAARVKTDLELEQATVSMRFKTEKKDAGLFWCRSPKGGLAMFLNDGILQLKYGYGNPVPVPKGLDLADGRYHHVAWEVDNRTGGYRAFVDGVLCYTQESNRKLEMKPYEEFLIGGAYGGGPFRNFVGLLDDFRVYSRSLTPEEIRKLADPL